ncbi:DUF3027 domain-containing protein [Microbacterium sp. bgisy203]|uniref:DUF3027 domain-containing protein n=1 Tax=Microbacterium sp. bgisy203 TaxID=3413799 RepID=UPI003D709B56
MTSTPDVPDADARLVAAHDLALAALHEITPAFTVGTASGYTVEDDGVVSLRFSNTMEGYPGWFWTVSVAVVDDAEPTVLEAELLPGQGALLAPEWIPWAVRLAEYQAAQAALAAEAGDGDDLDDLGGRDAADGEDAEDDVDDADLDDLEDLDAADFDDDGSPILHAGDVDGVDIDELDESGDDDEDEDESEADEDDESEADEDDDESEDDPAER